MDDNDLTLAQLDAVLVYLPVISAPGCSFGAWHTQPGEMPYFAYSPAVQQFIASLYAQGLIVKFDWGAWRETANALMQDPALLSQAGLFTLRRLLTAHVRQDRFIEGHLAQMLANGHITAILRRLQQIRAARAG